MNVLNPLAWPVFVQGLALSLGLIVGIGAQNAFGLRREHVLPVVAVCALADAVRITAGVLGMAQALGDRPGLVRVLALAGAAFLAVYGWQALRRAGQASQLTAAEAVSGASAANLLWFCALGLAGPVVCPAPGVAGARWFDRGHDVGLVGASGAA